MGVLGLNERIYYGRDEGGSENELELGHYRQEPQRKMVLIEEERE